MSAVQLCQQPLLVPLAAKSISATKQQEVTPTVVHHVAGGEHNRVYFKTREEVINAGYVPCKRCSP